MCDLFNSFDWVMLLECGYDECPDGSSLALHSNFCACLYSPTPSTTFSGTDILFQGIGIRRGLQPVDVNWTSTGIALQVVRGTKWELLLGPDELVWRLSLQLVGIM